MVDQNFHIFQHLERFFFFGIVVLKEQDYSELCQVTEQVCPKKCLLSTFPPLKMIFTKVRLVFHKRSIHAYMNFPGLRIVTFVSSFVWSITDENTFFSFRIKFGSEFTGYVNKYYATQNFYWQILLYSCVRKSFFKAI